ncbi:MAG: polysaccharide lyase family protein, partial [Planctomycetota bacterium]
MAVVVGILLPAIGFCAFAAEADQTQAPLFLLGTPDNHAAEFGLTGAGEGYLAFSTRYPDDVVYTVGRSKPHEWPYIHPAVRDTWAGGRAHTFTIRFQSARDEDRPLFLVIGMAGGSPTQCSKVVVTVDRAALPAQVAPGGDPRVCFQPTAPGKAESMIFEIPPGLVRKGENSVSIRLDEESWIIYDYVALAAERKPLELVEPPEPDLLAEFRQGPMAGVDEIIFAARALGEDPHWYANFGRTLDHSNWRTYGRGGRLAKLSLTTGEVTVLVDDPQGGVRDPVVHYDGQKVLFSYRKGDSPHYRLYEINVDGSGLRQLTDGPYDDLEPVYLPDGRIMFVSTRSNRCVNCHTTDVAVLYCCEADGSNVRALSANNEHDNTPWVLPSGQVLYTRWEYVDRSQVRFHHLWITSADGLRQSIFYGNMHPGTTMIDAKPIPGSRNVVASFSPGHGRREHDGVVTVVDPRNGPDDQKSARAISHSSNYRDPWAFSEEAFMAASGTRVVLMDSRGRTQAIYELPEGDVEAGLECHEPRPLWRRLREPVMPDQVDWTGQTGRVLVVDVHKGRNMAGVTPGEIKKLLVLEALPKPMNFTGGMEPISYGGTFNLERILGTIPVEPDGSAYAELPALRGLFFVALDENDLSVKRMQSFVSVLPGETTTCIGCHEQRTQTPQFQPAELMALRRPPRQIEPIADVPEILDYPRDVQPILDKHCVECHDYDRPGTAGAPCAAWSRWSGGVVLTGDRGPVFSISYYTMTALDLVSDGRNGLGNRAPRTIGSSASRLMTLVDGSHYEAKLSE